MKQFLYCVGVVASLALMAVCLYFAYDALMYSFTPEAHWGSGVTISRVYCFMFTDLAGLPLAAGVACFLEAVRG